MPPLTWLHLSDLHACRARSGWDAGRVRETLVKDLMELEREHGLRPDLIFFTGDAAFGDLGNEPGERIEEQFGEAAAFLDAVRRAFSPEVPRSNLFLVPGNHDVDRRQVSPALTRWLAEQRELDPVRRLIQDAGFDWRMGMARLAPYLEFLRASDLAHLLEDANRAIWSAVRTIGGRRVGIAGFNSAWSCGRDQERGRLWAAGAWQQGTLRERLAGTDFNVALIHHPPEWLVEHENPEFPRRLRQDFRFLLHGHEHQDWVASGDDGFTTIAAGACYDRSERPNGYNFVRLDPASGEGEVWLRQYDATGGGWVERRIHQQTDRRGVRTFRPAWLRELDVAATSTPAIPELPASPSLLTATPDLEDLARYVKRLRSAHRDIPIAGFATRVRMPIRLESVYIPMRAQVVHHGLESEHKKPGAYRELAGEGKDREVAFDEALQVAAKHGLRGAVIIGDPGSGKTTLLKHFLLCDLVRFGLPPETVPVFVELRRLNAPTAGLRSVFTEAVGRADPSLDAAEFAIGLLKRDHLLVLVDGLDEIADPAERSEVSRLLEEAVGTLPHSTFVVSSRYSGYKGDARLSGRFLELHVHDLAEPEARRFIHDWYGAIEAQAELGRAPEVAKRLAEEAASELAGRIFDPADPRTSSLRDLASNPLMLQILCLVHRDRKNLPERRIELYWECCQVLLELWRGAKKLPMTLSAAQSLKLLQPLAHWLHANERKEATAAEIQPLLAAPLRELGREPTDAEALLAMIRDQSGVLVNVGAAYTFLHLSFQEYLCARHLQDQALRSPGLLADLAGHFGETWWREVTLLAVGLSNPDLFEPVMQAILDQEVLHRDIVLADDCLRDASAPTARPLLAALAGGLKSAEERYHALRLLAALPSWEAEVLPDGTTGREVVKRLVADGDPQVQGLIRELLGLPAAARTTRPGGPTPGEERRNEVDGTVLLYVPGGEYVLGADDISADEKPVHRVLLSPFWIAKYLVTNEQYARFLRADPEAARPALWDDKQFNQPNQPVVGVSWEEAQAYCRWAGLTLPSEAQWEAAARGTDGRRYPWGNDEPTAKHANFGGRERGPSPVGAFPRGAGPFGTLDQAGNVWEWCVDVWDEKAYRRKERAEEDPVGTRGDAAVRCLRGGSWGVPAGLLAAACRDRLGASGRSRLIGFRCLLLARPEP
jgi:formylglycine-generating enzyme required for sulfatase activity